MNESRAYVIVETSPHARDRILGVALDEDAAFKIVRIQLKEAAMNGDRYSFRLDVAPLIKD